jgi:hypothetical protein
MVALVRDDQVALTGGYAHGTVKAGLLERLEPIFPPTRLDIRESWGVHHPKEGRHLHGGKI